MAEIGSGCVQSGTSIFDWTPPDRETALVLGDRQTAELRAEQGMGRF